MSVSMDDTRRIRHTRDSASRCRFGGPDGIVFDSGSREREVDTATAEWAVETFDAIEYADSDDASDAPSGEVVDAEREDNRDSEPDRDSDSEPEPEPDPDPDPEPEPESEQDSEPESEPADSGSDTVGGLPLDDAEGDDPTCAVCGRDWPCDIHSDG